MSLTGHVHPEVDSLPAAACLTSAPTGVAYLSLGIVPARALASRGVMTLMRPAYRPRDAERGVLRTVVRAHLETFLREAAHRADGAVPRGDALRLVLKLVALCGAFLKERPRSRRSRKIGHAHNVRRSSGDKLRNSLDSQPLSRKTKGGIEPVFQPGTMFQPIMLDI